MPVQQLLLYTFVVIIGIGLLLLAHEMYLHMEKETGRNSMKVELSSLAREAYRYYYRPTYLGGGAHSFDGFQGVESTGSSLSPMDSPPEGSYVYSEMESGQYAVAAAATDSVVLVGIGNILGDDGTHPIVVGYIVKISGSYSVEAN